MSYLIHKGCGGKVKKSKSWTGFFLCQKCDYLIYDGLVNGTIYRKNKEENKNKGMEYYNTKTERYERDGKPSRKKKEEENNRPYFDSTTNTMYLPKVKSKPKECVHEKKSYSKNSFVLIVANGFIKHLSLGKLQKQVFAQTVE